jgi:phosphoribosylformimino-5-aminoimidazole carboxamide ribotide isomerase
VELIPAIDLLAGRVVRLRQGAYDAVTDFGTDPVAVARRWEADGATRLHLVDLAAARSGTREQADLVDRIVGSVGVPCQVAGGIRGAQHAADALAAGADRVVLGSALISDPGLARRLVEAHGSERIAAALDVRDGRAVGDGWVPGARGAAASDLAAALVDHGIRRFIVTAVARDGLSSGPDLDLLEAVRATVPDALIVASGGIASLSDVRAIADRGFEAAILGRALYEGAFTLRDALAIPG